jgi:hypothetical protein
MVDMTVIPAVRRQRDRRVMSSRSPWAIYGDPVSEKNRRKDKQN